MIKLETIVYICPKMDICCKLSCKEEKMENKRERTSKFIKQNFLILLKEKSLDKITVNDLCEKSMIRRSTFYNHYQDKYQVLESINVDICLSLEKKLQERFYSNELKDILFSDIDRESFLIMISIQDGTVNLQRDLKTILKIGFKNFLTENYLLTKLNVEIDFLEEIFSTLALTNLEYTILNGPNQRNIEFLNEIQKNIFKFIEAK